MDLIDEAILPGIENRSPVKKAFQKIEPPRSINSREPHRHSALIDHELLRLPQNLAGLVLWLRRAFFCRPFAVGLRINAGAAGKEHYRFGKPTEKIACAVQIDATIKIHIAATSTGAVNHRFEISWTRGNFARV